MSNKISKIRYKKRKKVYGNLASRRAIKSAGKDGGSYGLALSLAGNGPRSKRRVSAVHKIFSIAKRCQRRGIVVFVGKLKPKKPNSGLRSVVKVKVYLPKIYHDKLKKKKKNKRRQRTTKNNHKKNFFSTDISQPSEAVSLSKGPVVQKKEDKKPKLKLKGKGVCMRRSVTYICAVPGINHNISKFSQVLIRHCEVRDHPGVHFRVIRGKLDAQHVANRFSSRSKYGIKKLDLPYRKTNKK